MDRPVWDFRFSQLCYMQCDTVLLGKKSLTLQWNIVHSSSGSSSILILLAIQMKAQSSSKMSVMGHPTTQHHIPKCLNLHGQMFMIKDLVYHNHLWSSHSSARRWTVWVQKPLILRHYVVVHGRWISLEGLYSQHQNAMLQVCQLCNEFWNTE